MSKTKEILTAVDQGDVEQTRSLLGGDTTLSRASGDHNVTPLHAAAEKDHREIAELLLDAGADLEAETTWGMTPLQWAANMGSKSVGELLLARGAKLNMWAAAGLGMLDAVQTFFDGPDQLKPGAAQCRYQQLLDGNWEKIPPPDDERDALSDAFYIACRNGHKEVAEILLERGADVNFRGFFGGTGLHWAAMNGHRKTVEFLLANGARKDIKDEQFEATPHGWALEGKREEIAALLE